MLAGKAVRFRPACSYALALCTAFAAWGATRYAPMPGIVRALDQTGRDSLLPLERFAVETAITPPSALQPTQETPQRLSHPLPRQVDLSPRLLQRKAAAQGYCPKIEDWTHWT